MTFLLAQNVSSEFLLDPVKPVVVFVTALLASALVSRLVTDIRLCGLPAPKWHGILIGGLVAGFLAGILVPTIWISWPVQVLLTAGPLCLYWKTRNAMVPEKLKFIIGGDKVRAFFQKRGTVKSLAGAQLSFKDANKKDRPNPGKNDPVLPAFQAADKLLGIAVQRRATRVDLVVKPDGAVAAVTVDGIRGKVDAPTPEVSMAMIDFLKDLCGLDVKERRKRQTGACWAVEGERLIPLSLSIAGSSAGQQLRIDLDRVKNMTRTIPQVGFLPAQEKAIQAIMDPIDRGGVVLVSAPPGFGLTSTCLALLSGHDAFTAAVKTLEKNLVLRLDGVDHQTWASTQGGVDYPTHLQSIIRRSPDVVYVEDLSEVGVGKLIAAPSNNDMRFYVAIPVDGVAAAITEWFKAVGDVKMAAAPLRMVVAQKLCRKLCSACRVPYQPSPEQAKKLGIAAGKQVELFKASGKVQAKSKVIDCPMCNGTGYSGQIVISEVLIIDPEAREFLSKGDLKSAYNSSRMKHKLPGMQEAALLRVRDGTTSLEEAVRLLAPAAAKPAAPASTAAKPSSPPSAGKPASPTSGAKPATPPSGAKPPTKPKA
ncbi:MAG: Flp pilus assembly complex ATPase component TadA [Planctomycetes bacterium]|nr:Flp pilus assembly complex ATPase component TadA [Planctomycetota bacterium]